MVVQKHVGMLAFVFVVITLFCLSFSYAFTFNLGPSIFSSTGNYTTGAGLICGFSATGLGSLYANVTWYVDGVPHVTDNQTISFTSGVAENTTASGSIEAFEASKGESWICSIKLYNSTNATSWVNSSAVTIVNSLPEVTFPLLNQSSTEDSLFGPLVATAYDPDGDSLSWYSSDLNKSLYGGKDLFDILTNGTISFTPTSFFNGRHYMALNAYDGSSSGGVVLVFDVAPINDAPNVTSPLAFECTEGSSCAFTFVGVDEEDNVPLYFETNSSLFTLTADDAYSASFDFVPVFAQTGVHYINLTVNDSLNVQKSELFTLTIQSINHAPEVLANISNDVGTQGALFTADISANDTEVSDQILFQISAYNCSLGNPWAGTYTTLYNGSQNATVQISTVLTNDHIACQQINVTATDFNGTIKNTTTRIFNLSLINTNDPPYINEMSNYSENSWYNTNISDITAPNGLVSYYRVNVSDNDTYTYEGENFTFIVNDTLSGLLTINASTGLITINPNISIVGNYSILINVTDDDGLMDSAIMNLSVIVNSVPYFVGLGNITCREGILCTEYIEGFDTDVENLTIFTNDTLVNLTKINITHYLLNHTYLQTEIGNYTVLFTVRDEYGATTTEVVNFSIVNKNDVPFFDIDFDGDPDNFTFPYIVVDYHSLIYINVTDFDLLLGIDTINFSVNITSGPNTNLFNISKLSNNQAFLDFTPVEADLGNYTVNIRVDDAFGGYNITQINFTVYNVSVPPVITHVKPYHNSTSGIDMYTYGALVDIGGSSTALTLEENNSLTFGVQFTDSDSVDENVTIYWYFDGALMNYSRGDVSTEWAHFFDFFSSGQHEVVAVVQDNLYSKVNFTYIVDVDNVNRVPYLKEVFTGLNVSGRTTVTDQALFFYDPDDDIDSNGFIDGNETNNLIYTYNYVNGYFTLEFENDDIIYVPTATGTVYNFSIRATDADDGFVDSNFYDVSVVYLVEEEQQFVPQGGGGGGSSTKAVSVPEPKIVIEYSPIDIIVPRPVTVYQNETVKAPISIVNKGDRDLAEIFITGETNVSNVTITVVGAYIPLLRPGQSADAAVIVANYRGEGTYEIFVNASVNSPQFSDSAIIYVNSVEKGQDSGDAVNTKLAFARDLLDNNPRCIELNEILDQANIMIRNGQTVEAQQAISGVVEGCKYLIASKDKHIEEPTDLSLSRFMKNKYMNAIVMGILLIIVTVIILLYIKFKDLDKID